VPTAVTGDVLTLPVDACGVVLVGLGHGILLWLTFCVYTSTLYYICQ
jgi:hypothetical protein